MMIGPNSLFTPLTLHIGYKEDGNLHSRNRRNIPLTLAKLTRLEKTGQQIGKFHFDNGLKVIRHALAARYLLKDAIRRNVAIDIQIICDTSQNLCARYETHELVTTMALSTLRLLDSMSAGREVSKEKELQISKRCSLQALSKRITECRNLAHRAVLESNIELVDHAKTMANEVALLWHTAVTFTRCWRHSVSFSMHKDFRYSALKNQDVNHATSISLEPVGEELKDTSDYRISCSAVNPLKKHENYNMVSAGQGGTDTGTELAKWENKCGSMERLVCFDGGVGVQGHPKEDLKRVCTLKGDCISGSGAPNDTTGASATTFGHNRGVQKRVWITFAILSLSLSFVGLVTGFLLASAKCTNLERGAGPHNKSGHDVYFRQASCENIYSTIQRNDDRIVVDNACGARVGCRQEGSDCGVMHAGRTESSATGAHLTPVSTSLFQHALNISTKTVPSFVMYVVVRIFSTLLTFLVNSI